MQHFTMFVDEGVPREDKETDVAGQNPTEAGH
jgi:hypothetical protein